MIKIEDDVENFQGTMEGDYTISSTFAAACKTDLISKSEGRNANKYRQYLRLFIVAGLISGYDIHIDQGVLRGTFKLHKVRKFGWTKHGKPKTTDRVVWRKVLERSMSSTQNQILVHIGTWVNNMKGI